MWASPICFYPLWRISYNNLQSQLFEQEVGLRLIGFYPLWRIYYKKWELHWSESVQFPFLFGANLILK
jgi:hypothetical protein